jgi:Chemoreceptor zinc-binding domain
MSGPALLKEINDAIGAHGMWKMRLRTAINTGASDIAPRDAGCDDRCQFGAWLHGPQIDQQTKGGMPYQVIKRLHADFHRSAGTVLQDAVSGRKDAAEQALTGEFAEKSEKLVRALNKWKRELL